MNRLPQASLSHLTLCVTLEEKMLCTQQHNLGAALEAWGCRCSTYFCYSMLTFTPYMHDKWSQCVPTTETFVLSEM